MFIFKKGEEFIFTIFLPINFLEKIKLLLISLLKFLPIIILKKSTLLGDIFINFQNFPQLVK